MRRGYPLQPDVFRKLTEKDPGFETVPYFGGDNHEQAIQQRIIETLEQRVGCDLRTNGEEKDAVIFEVANSHNIRYSMPPDIQEGPRKELQGDGPPKSGL